MANLATITTNILADSGIDDINVVVTTGSYSNPAWITSLAWTKITGAPANIVTGTGTTNFVPKFTGASTIGNSVIQEASGFIGIGVSPSSNIDILGSSSRLRLDGTSSSFQILSRNTANSSTNPLIFDADTYTYNRGGVFRMTLDSSGNLGLGVTPSAWGVVAFQRGSTSLYEYNTNNSILSSNFYFDGAANRYLNNGFATYYQQFNGTHSWNLSASGTAGNAISFTQAMTLTASSKLLVNTTADSGNYFIQANGNIASINSSAAGLFTVSGTRSIGIQSFAGDWNYISSNGNPLVIRTQDANTLYIRTSDVDRLTISSTGAATFSSSVTAGGIITGSDNFTAINGGWFFNGSGNYASGIFASSSSNVLTLRSPQRIFFQIGFSTEAMTISSSGNLLIGTTTDNGARLQVNGTATFSGALRFAADVWNTTGDGLERLFFSANSITYLKGNGVVIRDNSDVNMLSFVAGGAATFSSSVTAGGDITSRTSLNAITLSNTEPYVFLARNSGSNGVGVIRTLDGGALAFDNGATGASQSTKMTILAGGNVGIGTDSPSRTFQVNGYISSFDGTTNTEIISAGGVGYFGTSTNHPLVLQTNNTERMRITSGGELQVKGNGVIRNEESGGNFSYWQQTSSDVRFAVQYSQPLRFFTNNTEAMRITPSGRVLIGTPPPAESTFTLDVNGGGRFQSNIILNSDGTYGGNYMTVGFGGTTNGFNRIFGGTSGSVDGMFIASATGRSIFLRAGGGTTDNLTVIPSGNVGIGTASPQQALHVNGIVLLENNQSIRWFNNASAQRTLLTLDSNNDFQVGGSISNIRFLTNDSTERMRINESGDILFKGQDTAATLGARFVNNSNELAFYSSNDTSGPSKAISFYNRFGASELRLRIASNGNVLIGTTDNPGDLLRVNQNTFTNTITTYRPGVNTTKSDAWKLGRAALGTQPTETHQITVEIGGVSYVIGAAQL
jgi:hypothetical protein